MRTTALKTILMSTPTSPLLIDRYSETREGAARFSLLGLPTKTLLILVLLVKVQLVRAMKSRSLCLISTITDLIMNFRKVCSNQPLTISILVLANAKTF